MKRIDIELVLRGLFETRSKAQFSIKNGVILCNGKVIKKTSYLVKPEDKLSIKENVLPYVSKGGLKLERALKYFKIILKNKKMIDIGASTGGFTDCAIKYGIKNVIAIDVGNMQFNPNLLKTNKVILLENTDFRDIDISFLKGYSIATIDISFISVRKIIDKLASLDDLQEIVLLIKPQFECGKYLAKKYSGVIVNKDIHIDIIYHIVSKFNEINFGLQDLTYSPIRGGSGNIEYLSYFKKNLKIIVLILKK